MISYLKEILAHVPADYAELRYHERRVNAVSVRKGEPEAAQANHLAGVGVRLLDSGRWGFSSTPGSKRADIMRAIGDAATAAKAMSRTKKNLAKAKLAKGEFHPPVEDPVENNSLEERLELVKKAEAKAR
ncbi:MAG: hypothetical protein E3J71_01800, partial [Candidatus Stahlbacteria bacterium]